MQNGKTLKKIVGYKVPSYRMYQGYGATGNSCSGDFWKGVAVGVGGVILLSFLSVMAEAR